MRIETVCTGDELLTGLTADTNSPFFQTQLLERVGETVRRNVVVGDTREDIIEALREAAARSDAVLVSGGLGPTTDDLTAECAAAFAQVPLVQSAEALQHLEERFRARGLTLTDNNRRQALVPQGAQVVLNAAGSAPMFALTVGQCLLCFVPGVPREYRHLVEQEVIPRLLQRKQAQGGATTHRLLLLLKTVGLPESHLDARVRPLAPRHPRITFGFRTHAPENHLKLLAEAPTLEEARAALEAAAAEARAVLGAHLFAEGEQSLEGVVVAALKQRGESVAFAESCTGGLVSSLITAVPGASAIFPGGLVTYAERLKTAWAFVPEALLVEHGAVSEACARAMAEGARRASGAVWAVSVTGYAGPDGGDDWPVGTVFIGCAGPEGTVVEHQRFVGDRERVRHFAAWTALDVLRRALEKGKSQA